MVHVAIDDISAHTAASVAHRIEILGYGSMLLVVLLFP